MAKKIVLEARLKGAEKTKRGLKGIDSGLKSLGKSAMVAGAAFFGVRAIISGLKKTIELSSKMEGLRRGFDNLAKSAGFSAQTFDKLKKATDGTMSSFDLMKQANNAMLLGIFDSDDAMAEMFDTAQRLAQALGKDAAFGIESLVTGMGRQSKLMLDNLGIMVKAEDAYKRYAEQLHKSVSELTDMERKQAFINESMKEANKLVASLGDEQLTTADSINQMKTAVGDAAEAIGNLLGPAVVIFARGIKFAAESVGGFIEAFQSFGKEVEIVKMMTDSEFAMTKFKQSLEELTFDELTALGEELNKQLPKGLAIISTMAPELQVVSDKLVLILEQMREIGVEPPPFPMPDPEEVDILDDIMASDAELAFQREENSAAQLAIQNKINDLKKKQVLDELKQAALVQGSAVDAMKAVVRAETMEAVAGYISSVLKSVPFPLNLILAAGGGALVGGLVDSALSSFAQGGNFVTSGPQMIMVGDNPSGRERVQITPSEQSQSFNQGGITLNISAPLIDETVIDSIIPAIQKAQRLNLA